jgi:carboxymethylenebutenolidase
MEPREVVIRGHDGHSFSGWLAVPAHGSGPGMVVVHEIFGVTDCIKEVCQRLAGLGYVALAPELFSRLQPGLVLDERTAENLPRALETGQRLDLPKAADDCIAALEELRRRPDVAGGRAGVIGFCLGGWPGLPRRVGLQPGRGRSLLRLREQTDDFLRRRFPIES